MVQGYNLKWKMNALSHLRNLVIRESSFAIAGESASHWHVTISMLGLVP